MAPAQPKSPKDSHPELSAPIVDLGLEARIARAEQQVMDGDARVRGDVRRIGDALRSRRGAAVRSAAIAGAAAAACALGYAGYKAWRGRGSAPPQHRSETPTKALGFASGLAALARIATQWGLKLHREQGVSGSIFKMVRDALWPAAHGASAQAREAAAPSAGPVG